MLLAFWVMGLLVTWALLRVGDWQQWAPLAWGVAVGSGVCALLSAIPGVVAEHSPGRLQSANRITVGFSLAMLIRLFCTVALFGLCRYHMPAALEESAKLVLIWYLDLTAVEVATLAKLLPRLDRPVEQPTDHPVEQSADPSIGSQDQADGDVAPSPMNRLGLVARP